MIEENKPIATVTGLYRGTFSGLEPLTKDIPLTLDEVRRNPIFYELELEPDLEDTDLIVDIIYDNVSPMRMQDLFRGTDIPKGIRFWPDWFDIPPTRRRRIWTVAGSIPGQPVSTRSGSEPPAGRSSSAGRSATSPR